MKAVSDTNDLIAAFVTDGVRSKLLIRMLVLLIMAFPVPPAAVFAAGDLRTVAVTDFEIAGEETGGKLLARKITDSLTNLMVKSGYVQMVERSKIHRILDEQKLILSGLIDTSRVSSAGKLMAADFVITGTLAGGENEWLSNVRLLEVASGKIIYAESFGAKTKSDLNRQVPEMAVGILEKIIASRPEEYVLTFLARPKEKRDGRLSTQQQDTLRSIMRRKIENSGGLVKTITLDPAGKLVIDAAIITDALWLSGLLMTDDVLEFRLVGYPEEGKTEAPEGFIPMKYREGEEKRPPILVKKEADLTGSDIENASVALDNFTGQPVVQIEFNRKGTKIFSELTRDNVRNQLAIVLNGEVLSAPVIQEEIRGGQAMISGVFTLEGAYRLALNLRAGRLPANLELLGIEKR
jgi:TolB-like protein